MAVGTETREPTFTTAGSMVLAPVTPLGCPRSSAGGGFQLPIPSPLSRHHNPPSPGLKDFDSCLKLMEKKKGNWKLPPGFQFRVDLDRLRGRSQGFPSSDPFFYFHQHEAG